MSPEEAKQADPTQREDIARLIEETITAFVERSRAAQADSRESALHTELAQERKKREQLEKRVNELIEEGRRARDMAEQTERFANIKSELQQLGVAKVDLAFRAVKDDIFRGEDSKLYARADDSVVSLREHLSQWVASNPEFKPARIAGGTGSSPARSGAAGASSFELERIRPGMSPEEMERARQEIARVAAQALGGHGL